MQGDSIYHEATLLRGILVHRESQIIELKKISKNDSISISNLTKSNGEKDMVIIQKDKDILKAKRNGYLYAAVPMILLILSLL